MKTIRRLYRISITSAGAFILFILMFLFFMNMILDLKDLSLQTWKAKSAWNDLAVVTDDILFLRFDSLGHLLELEETWSAGMRQMDAAFSELSTHRQLKILPKSLRAELVHAGYIWQFSRRRISDASRILDRLSEENQFNERILATGEPTLYENIRRLSWDPSAGREEKSAYRSFTANMAVFDMTRDEFQNILRRVNNEIPPIIERRIIMIYSCSLLLFLLTVSYVFVSLGRTARPIAELASAMLNIGKTDYRVAAPGMKVREEDDEIAIINKGISEMVGRIKSLYDRNLAIEKEKQATHLRALQYQINPHFLYNTLGSIQLAASLEKQERLAEVIRSLSSLLRKTIRKSKDLSPFAEELALIDDFLDIMQFRYGDGIGVEKEIAPRLYALFIPGQMLQPLLENAIQHGLNEKLNDGDGAARIVIKGELKEGRFLLTVGDNGAGMEEAVVRRIFAGGGREDSDHIGLSNIDQRLKLRFGDQYGLRIRSAPGAGTEATLVLPVIESHDG